MSYKKRQKSMWYLEWDTYDVKKASHNRRTQWLLLNFKDWLDVPQDN